MVPGLVPQGPHQPGSSLKDEGVEGKGALNTGKDSTLTQLIQHKIRLMKWEMEPKGVQTLTKYQAFFCLYEGLLKKPKKPYKKTIQVEIL